MNQEAINKIFTELRASGLHLSDAKLFQMLTDAQIELEASALGNWAEGVAFENGTDWRGISTAVKKISKQYGF